VTVRASKADKNSDGQTIAIPVTSKAAFVLVIAHLEGNW
jgi:hypothetical protein